MHFLLTSQFCRYAAASFDKQCHMANLVGTSAWHFHMLSGLLSFKNGHRWHVQLLGTESDETNTWLWAWANPSPSLNPGLLDIARMMKEYGEKHVIKELTTAQLPLSDIDGHLLATVASGTYGANAYFRAPYVGGAAFLLIKDDAFPPCTEPPLMRIAAIFPHTLAAFPIANHRLALRGYLAYYDLAGEVDDNRVIVSDGGKHQLRATFDEQNRLIHLEITVEGRDKAMAEAP